jgi:hypothetical protein
MRRLAHAALSAALGVAAACSGSGSGDPRRQPAAGSDEAPLPPPLEIDARPLGTAGLAGFGWRRGPGRDAFRRALAAEKKGDMAGVAREAAAALVADPGHLEAAWLVAVARARLGELDGVLAPLEIAAAGDWPKWGERSLDLQALAAFRDTPAGQAWVRAAERYRAALAAHLAGAVVVVARVAPPRLPRAADGPARIDQRAELYAVEPGGARWVRLTRTGGGVVGALPAPGRPLVAYAAYRELGRRSGGGASIRELRVGVVDLSTGRTAREVPLKDVHEVTLGWVERGAEPTLVARVVAARTSGGATAPRTYAIDWRQGQKRSTELPVPRDGLRVRPLSAQRRRIPIKGITADWDDTGTASAFRIDKSKKVVAPGGAMIDGHSLVWSPDGTRLAFATAAEDPCGHDTARAVAVHVVEAATGRARVVARGTGVPSPVWIDAARLAFGDGDGVRVLDVAASSELSRLGGGGGVVTAAFGETRACADDSAAPFAPPDPGDDWEEADVAGGALDAGDPAPPLPPAP